MSLLSPTLLSRRVCSVTANLGHSPPFQQMGMTYLQGWGLCGGDIDRIICMSAKSQTGEWLKASYKGIDEMRWLLWSPPPPKPIGWGCCAKWSSAGSGWTESKWHLGLTWYVPHVSPGTSTSFPPLLSHYVSWRELSGFIIHKRINITFDCLSDNPHCRPAIVP